VTFDQDSLIASALLTMNRLKATLLEQVFTEQAEIASLAPA